MQELRLDRPSDAALGAIIRLNVGDDFKLFLHHLESALQVVDRENRFAEGNQVYRKQGEAQTLATILDLCRDASKKLVARRGV